MLSLFRKLWTTGRRIKAAEAAAEEKHRLLDSLAPKLSALNDQINSLASSIEENTVQHTQELRKASGSMYAVKPNNEVAYVGGAAFRHKIPSNP